MNTPTDAIQKSASVCKSGSSILKVRGQIEKLSKHDIWLKVYGKTNCGVIKNYIALGQL